MNLECVHLYTTLSHSVSPDHDAILFVLVTEWPTLQVSIFFVLVTSYMVADAVTFLLLIVNVKLILVGTCYFSLHVTLTNHYGFASQ
jgi:hypothetical protein